MNPTCFNLSNNHCFGELGVAAINLERNLVERCLQQNEYSKFDLTSHQESSSQIGRHETEENTMLSVISASRIPASVSGQEQSGIYVSSLSSSTSSTCPVPLSRQFWKAGDYDDRLNSKPTCQNGTSYLRIHPKFLHSNATSHKWVFGALAELLDNAVDEIQNGATFVIVDKISNPRDRTPALLVRDDGGGMDPDAMRRCVSFGFSNKKSKNAIGQYGNGFKTSSMRLGADVVVFSRHKRDGKTTQSVGLLSYTFLMQTQQDRIVVPMVDYQLDAQTGKWSTIHNEIHLKNNLSILLQWSPFTTEAELLNQFEHIGLHGTKIIIYSLWHSVEGNIELDFDSDSEDICISRQENGITKTSSRKEAYEQHLANRLRYSLRAYLSVLYLRVPENFSILLRGRVVDYHNIANDLKFPQFIKYKPHKVQEPVITTIGFLKEAPAVNIHGFCVYHKNRLILPFWHVTNCAGSIGRGVVGVLEANFIEPIHNKQDFEKTPVLQKLEARLKDMLIEYWGFHCGLIGYQPRRKPQENSNSNASADPGQTHGVYQPVLLHRDSAPKLSTMDAATQQRIDASTKGIAAKSGMSEPDLPPTSQGATLKRKHHDFVNPERVKRIGVTVSTTTDTVHGGIVQHGTDSENQLEKEAEIFASENKEYRARCQEYEKTQEELALKVTHLKAEIEKARNEYAHLLSESELLEKYKREKREH